MQPVFATAGSFSMYLILSQRKQGHYRIGAKPVSTHTSALQAIRRNLAHHLSRTRTYLPTFLK
jgi:hypothetical protein